MCFTIKSRLNPRRELKQKSRSDVLVYIYTSAKIQFRSRFIKGVLVNLLFGKKCLMMTFITSVSINKIKIHFSYSGCLCLQNGCGVNNWEQPVFSLYFSFLLLPFAPSCILFIVFFCTCYLLLNVFYCKAHTDYLYCYHLHIIKLQVYV